MIAKSIFNKDWFAELKDKYKFQNAAVAEKMVHALCLVEELSKTDLDFVLKGGTSLILLISPTRKFSVDVDIITKSSRAEIEDFLNEICTNSEHFIKFELDERRSFKPGIPKAHYRLFYNSVNSDIEDRVLIDILIEDVNYPDVITRQIGTQWVNVIEPEINIKVPTIESVLGDKLTAFAPNTTGVRYDENKSLEIAKQLFDIGTLFDKVKNINSVSESFNSIVKKEIKYRELKITQADVLSDIIFTARLIASRDKQKSPEDKQHYREILSGIKMLNEFLINEKFRLDDAIVASSKAALIAAKIMKEDYSPIIFFSDDMDITKYMIANQNYNSLNKLRKVPGGPLYYWYQIINLLEI